MFFMVLRSSDEPADGDDGKHGAFARAVGLQTVMLGASDGMKSDQPTDERSQCSDQQQDREALGGASQGLVKPESVARAFGITQSLFDLHAQSIPIDDLDSTQSAQQQRACEQLLFSFA